MKKSEYLFIFKSYVIWIIALFIILFIAIKFVPLQKNFLGGGLGNYLSNPFFWAWGNFDGEHYTSIAKVGYGFGEHAFFPLFSVLINFFAKLFGSTTISLYTAGIGISWLSFILGLIGYYKLAKFDYSEKISKMAVILLLVFPVSFYFASVYTESLFFALAVWSLVFAREKHWVLASIFGMLLATTRFVGIVIFPVLLIEWYTQTGKQLSFKKFPWSLLAIPFGTLSYIYYLLKNTGNAIAFYNELTIYGQQRSGHPIILPQVFYRYIFKILPALNTTFLPIVYTTILEFGIGISYLLLSLYSFFKLRVSYAVFILFGYLIPTLSGSFSSLPRYVLVLFPVYFLIASYLSKSRLLFFAFSLVSSILLIISFTLFARGYWVS